MGVLMIGTRVMRLAISMRKMDTVGTLELTGLFFMLYIATVGLSVTRVTVVLLGLYMNPFNVYTPIAFVYDMWCASCSDERLLIFTGYAAIFLACNMFQMYFSKLEVSSIRGAIDVKIALTILVLAFVGLFFCDLESFNALYCFSYVVSLALFLLAAQDCEVKISHWNPLILLVLSMVFSNLVFSTKFNLSSFLFEIVISALIKADQNYDFSNLRSMSRSQPSDKSIIREIVEHKDTRAIFNFLLLNTSFMIVQLMYSFRSKSLGLLSDSLHMALDCSSLALGLVAGVLLKRDTDPNGRFPFGLKNFEILAGFTNGTLLVGISCSILFEAFGRLLSPVSLQNTTELIIVSFLGLLVNLVGIFAFNHGHAHGHGHSHSHAQTSCEHDHGHGHSHSQTHSHSHSHSHDESHHDDKQNINGDHNHVEKSQTSMLLASMNDNMRGIFLHVLADTLGSVGVVLSTILAKFFSWDGFDAIASIFISVLIFFSAVPLVKSTSQSLLLGLDKRKENVVRSLLNEVLHIKGVKSFTTPRFWPTSDSSQICGYLHVQIYRGESLTYTRKQCEQIFKKEGVNTLLQIEYDIDSCWCRSDSAIKLEAK